MAFSCGNVVSPTVYAQLYKLTTQDDSSTSGVLGSDPTFVWHASDFRIRISRQISLSCSERSAERGTLPSTTASRALEKPRNYYLKPMVFSRLRCISQSTSARVFFKDLKALL